ncbi:glycosyltransferase family 4 protein [Gramella jeungdoensis]|uniref:Glycosyltransferase family 4 protein n=1 Tax=Gramella jeungdoensis TaxID=708091 RepID=A0ABT0YXU7_9FLAO|nr:glycosyltransferase family 4 protein [Gramella jeungdoensis]MCM8568164.1 glycosyltransferase family 4 protein [Gramella jeungdoensis]
MKVLHLSAVKTFGGGENHILNLCREMSDFSGVENFILTVKNSTFSNVLKDHDIRHIRAPLSIKFDLRYSIKIISICKKEKIDLIHIHDPTALTLAVSATKLAKLPPFILSKKTSFPIKNRKRTLYKYNHQNIKKVLCVSEETKRITSEGIKDGSKLVTIYHGTTNNKPGTAPFRLREKLNIPSDKIIVGTVANHIRAKNLETWVKLIDHLINIKEQKHFHFIQIGSFTKRTKIYTEMIKEKGLENAINFMGFLPNGSDFIPQFDISLLTSQSEGLPQFIYESFYHKVPVVSTNVGGIPEVIKDSENGLLTNPYEIESLADKLIALSRDRELQQKFAEKSYKILEENFTTSVMAERTLFEYKNVLYGKN